MRILIVDDEADLRTALRQLLMEQQYTADAAADGEEGLDMARGGIYDLLIVDVMMPGMSGTDLVRALREEGDATPVLLLTARDGVDDRVAGLDSGADDYLVKPFHSRELLARVRALARRAGELLGVRSLTAGDYSLDLIGRSVSFRGATIPLTHKEFQLMELFMRNRGRVLARETIFDRIWGYESDIDSNVLETYVHFLRRKLDAFQKRGKSPRTSPAIETVRGVGYVFRET